MPLPVGVLRRNLASSEAFASVRRALTPRYNPKIMPRPSKTIVTGFLLSFEIVLIQSGGRNIPVVAAVDVRNVLGLPMSQLARRGRVVKNYQNRLSFHHFVFPIVTAVRWRNRIHALVWKNPDRRDISTALTPPGCLHFLGSGHDVSSVNTHCYQLLHRPPRPTG